MIQKKWLLLLLCLYTFFPISLKAHELKKSTLLQNNFKFRAAYDNCMQKANTNAQSQKNCRKVYALTKAFSPKSLYHLHMEHPLEAQELYFDMLISIKGQVQRIGQSPLGQPEIVMTLDAYGLSGVRIEFSKVFLPQIKKLSEGATVNIMGICKGMLTENYIRIVHGEFIN